jgi:hypothetical protein
VAEPPVLGEPPWFDPPVVEPPVLGEPPWFDPPAAEPPVLGEPPWFEPPVAVDPPGAELPPVDVTPPDFAVPPVAAEFLLLLGAHPNANNTKENPKAPIAHVLERWDLRFRMIRSCFWALLG